MKTYTLNEMRVVEITKGERVFRFAFDRQDDPAEGVTLTGIFENGSRVRPSSIPDSEIPYDEAERQLIK